jgi:hypothetical protein
MKTRLFVLILILPLAVMITSDGFAKRKKTISDEDLAKAYTGTWINEEYKYEWWRVEKFVLLADGTWERYPEIHSDDYFYQGKNNVLDKWKDSDGNIWFECHWECSTHGNSGHRIIKISDSGNTFEMLSVVGEIRFEEWDPESYPTLYWRFYRQE